MSSQNIGYLADIRPYYGAWSLPSICLRSVIYFRAEWSDASKSTLSTTLPTSATRTILPPRKGMTHTNCGRTKLMKGMAWLLCEEAVQSIRNDYRFGRSDIHPLRLFISTTRFEPYFVLFYLPRLVLRTLNNFPAKFNSSVNSSVLDDFHATPHMLFVGRHFEAYHTLMCSRKLTHAQLRLIVLICRFGQ